MRRVTAMRRRSGDSEDYPSGLTACRLRIRRMLCFLKHHGLTAAARQLEAETGVFLDAVYMRYLMRIGFWAEAEGYLQHFLPGPARRSPQSTCLVLHLRSASTLAGVAAGIPGLASTFDKLGPSVSHFRHVLHKMEADQPRASMLWKKVAPTAVETAMDLLAKCPELKGKMHLPRDQPMPWEATPLIGARGSQRRRNKAAVHTPPDVVIRALKRQKRSLSTLETDASSGFPSNASSSGVALKTQTEHNASEPIVQKEQQKENEETAPETQEEQETPQV